MKILRYKNIKIKFFKTWKFDPNTMRKRLLRLIPRWRYCHDTFESKKQYYKLLIQWFGIGMDIEVERDYITDEEVREMVEQSNPGYTNF